MRVAVLGMGAMGRAVADALRAAGHRVTVWNRTPGRDTAQVARGAMRAARPEEAVAASDLVLVTVLDRAAVEGVLSPGPVVSALAGRPVVVCTTLTPRDARELSAWASRRGIPYLAGAMMATPPLVGKPEAEFLFSGPQEIFGAHAGTLRALGTVSFVGTDPGRASLWDLALLAGRYGMFAGYWHGAALLPTGGVPAKEFTAKAVPFLQAMAAALPLGTDRIDSGDYTAGEQSLEFNHKAVDLIVAASREQGIATDVPGVAQSLMARQIARGFGRESASRVFEEIRYGGAPRR